MDPEAVAELAAIEATLRGESVDPEHAELAELAVLVAAERPEIDEEFATALDRRVAGRFGREPVPRRRRRTWVVSGVAAAAVGALVAVVVVGSSRPASRVATTAAAPSVAGAARSPESGATATQPGATATQPQPPSSSRKVVQSAQLSLTTAPARIEDVAGQVFDVVRSVGGFVAQSSVSATGGTDSYAQFQLSVPSASLSAAMARLSRLHGAHVASRTDATQDVTDQYGRLNRQLSDARALRSSLLKQLAGASSPEQVASLKAQIADAEAAISRAQSALNSLNHQINYTQISLTLSTDSGPVGGGGFTIGRGARDAGHVLTVAAGVALIVLAVLVPVGLLGALLWWIGAALRRRRRDQALDLA